MFDLDVISVTSDAFVDMQMRYEEQSVVRKC
jgi:hypothetical protein